MAIWTRGAKRDPDDHTPWRLGFASGVFFVFSLVSTVTYVATLWVSYFHTGVEPPKTYGSPLHVPTGAGQGVYLMTVQEESRVRGGGSRWQTFGGFERVSHVDLWRLDARTAQPVWRQRLRTSQGDSRLDIGVLGADGDRLWFFLEGPVVASLAKGEVFGGAHVIEERNPQLKGVVPREKTHYAFYAGHGLVFTAADARAWKVDAATFNTTPWDPKAPRTNPGAIALAYHTPNATYAFQKRGLTLAKNWVGVLTDEEGDAMNKGPRVPGAKEGERKGAMYAFYESMHAPPDLSHGGPKRYRLWQSKVESVSRAPPDWPKNFPDNWGKRPRYSEFRPFDKSPQYLQAGLLSDGRTNSLPLLPKDPDSVLLLHRDRIDRQGRYTVTRIAGPDGRVLWDAPMPLSIVQSVMPFEDTLLLFGRAFMSPLPEIGDPYHSAHEYLIAIDMKTGAVKPFNISAADAR